MKTQLLLNKDKQELFNLYNNPNYLKLNRIDDFSSYETAVLILINSEIPIPFHVKDNEENELITFSSFDNNIGHFKKVTFKFKDDISTNSIFLNTFGVISTQKYEICEFDKSSKILQNDFIEKKIFNITKIEQNADGITNINIDNLFLGNLDNNLIECVLKIDGIVLCSQIIKDKIINFIDFPNVLWLNRKRIMANIEFYLRFHKTVNLSNFLKLTINYDIIYLETNSREKILNCHKYILETSNGDIIISIDGKFGVRYFTQFIDKIHPEIKFLYDSQSILKKIDIHENIQNKDLSNIKIYI